MTFISQFLSGPGMDGGNICWHFVAFLFVYLDIYDATLAVVTSSPWCQQRCQVCLNYAWQPGINVQEPRGEFCDHFDDLDYYRRLIISASHNCTFYEAFCPHSVQVQSEWIIGCLVNSL